MKSVSKVLATALLAGMVAAAARADVVTDWNATTNGLVANDVGNNPRLRTLAMVHVAMSDAINTVQNRYTRVVATLPAAPGASVKGSDPFPPAPVSTSARNWSGKRQPGCSSIVANATRSCGLKRTASSRRK